jgi:UDP-GlcNAc:undecaprenyl-phosphate GlcNAc-1-phosphate transferase
VAPFMVLFVPILDAIASLVRRFLRRKPVFEGDRGHIHHRLLDRGLSSGQTVLMLSGVSSVGAVLSLAATAPYPPLYRAALVAFCGFLALVVWVAIHRFGYVEIAFALRMLARGQFNRRLLEAELCLHELERTLDREQSVEACWCAIQRISDLLGFQGVTLRLRGFVYGSQGECREDECCWKLCISLPEDTGIDLFQRFVMPGASIIPISVVGPLRDLLSRKVHALMSSPYPHHGEEELQARRAAAL